MRREVRTYYVTGESQGIRHIGETVEATSASEAIRQVIAKYDGFNKRARPVLINRFSDRVLSTVDILNGDYDDSGRFGMYVDVYRQQAASSTGDVFNANRR